MRDVDDAGDACASGSVTVRFEEGRGSLLGPRFLSCSSVTRGPNRPEFEAAMA